MGEFSKGMRQRAKVAAALANDPLVLVLDEPLNGTDPVQRARLISLFRSLGDQGRTVIVSSHILQEVERMTDRVIAMVDGKLAAAGDITAIRAAMAHIPYRVVVDADDVRSLGVGPHPRRRGLRRAPRGRQAPRRDHQPPGPRNHTSRLPPRSSVSG